MNDHCSQITRKEEKREKGEREGKAGAATAGGARFAGTAGVPGPQQMFFCLLGRSTRPQTRQRPEVFRKLLQPIFALRAHCARDARGPTQSLQSLRSLRPPYI